MLVLSRKLNETIVIDGGIEITIIRIDRKQIRLAIKAPDEVGILRGELVVPIETVGGITVAEGRPSPA